MPEPDSEPKATLTAYLGRPPTPAELAVYDAQRLRLQTGIFDNPLLPRAAVGAELVTLPFAGDLR